MKQFGLTLACLLLFVGVETQNKNLTDDEPNLFTFNQSTNGKISQRETSTEEEIQARASAVVPNKFDRAQIEEESELSGSSQERAVVEKTLRDYLPYDTIQNFLVQILRPEAPILDSASDSEKNAVNRGNPADALGDFIVRGTETIARALNAVLDVPKKAIGSFSTGATEVLNKIGAYIIGI